MPDRHRVGVNVVRLDPVTARDRRDAAADGVDVAEREPRYRRVRGRWPGWTVDREGLLDDFQELGHNLVIAQLLGSLGDHRQIPFERPHLRMRNNEVGSLQARLGDVAAEHPFRHDVGLDRNLLATSRCVADGEAVVKGVEPGLETGREPQEPLTAKPELELDWLAGPGFRHLSTG